MSSSSSSDPAQDILNQRDISLSSEAAVDVAAAAAAAAGRIINSSDSPEVTLVNRMRRDQTSSTRRHGRNIILLLVIAAIYFFSRDTTTPISFARKESAAQFQEYLSNSQLAARQLENARSSIEGFSRLYSSLYERYSMEQSGSFIDSSDLNGIPSTELLFSTLYSLKRKTFAGNWTNAANGQYAFDSLRDSGSLWKPSSDNSKENEESRSQENSASSYDHSSENAQSRLQDKSTQKGLIGFLESNQGAVSLVISMQSASELAFSVQICEDRYVDHRQMLGTIIVPKGLNFTIIDRQINLSNLTFSYYFQDEFQVILGHKLNFTTQVDLSIEFGQDNNPLKYINKWSPILGIKLSTNNTQGTNSTEVEMDKKDDLPSEQKQISQLMQDYEKDKAAKKARKHKNYESIMGGIGVVSIAAQLDLEEENQILSRQTMYYAMFVTLILVAQFFFIIQIMKGFVTRENQELQFSLLSLSMACLWDGYLSFLHLFYAFNYDYWLLYFIIPCFLFMILWNVLEKGLLTIVWRARNESNDSIAIMNSMEQQDIMDENVLNRKKVFFYIYIYVALAVVLFMTQRLISKWWFLLLINTYLVPQIVRNARRGQQIKVDKQYVFGFLMIRSLILFYFRGCPENIAKLSPQYETCLGISALLFVQVSSQLNYISRYYQHTYYNYLIQTQVVILYGQQLLGPRFFIPAKWQKDCHDYYVKFDEVIDGERLDEVCNICLNQLSIQPILAEGEVNFLKSLVIQSKQRQNYIMQTPCEHKYHIPCLLKWMDIKLDCPTCRAKLPPMA